MLLKKYTRLEEEREKQEEEQEKKKKKEVENEEEEKGRSISETRTAGIWVRQKKPFDEVSVSVTVPSWKLYT